jgi:hypothetical protein
MSTVVEKVESDVTWIRMHERFLLILAGLLVIVFLGYTWMNRSSDNAIAANALAQQALQEQVVKNAESSKQNAELARQLASQVAQYQKMMDTLLAQNTALANAMKTRQAVVQKQQEVDKTLPLPDLAVRWEKLAALQPTDIQATDKGLTVNEAGSRLTVHILEEVPALQQDLTDTRQIVTNKNTQIAGLDGVVAGLNTQVAGLKDEQTGLKAEIAKADAACTTKIDLEKSKARRSKIKIFFAGLLTGAGICARLLL